MENKFPYSLEIMILLPSTNQPESTCWYRHMLYDSNRKSEEVSAFLDTCKTQNHLQQTKITWTITNHKPSNETIYLKKKIPFVIPDNLLKKDTFCYSTVKILLETYCNKFILKMFFRLKITKKKPQLPFRAVKRLSFRS